MTPTSALTAVRGLMDERRRYEAWLAGLEARRDTTPPRVFERVHADYTGRLDAVVEQLRTHTDGLRAEVGGLTKQLGALHDEQQKVRDERAEAELRAHVGEMPQDRWEVVARTADERIQSLEAQHAELETELERTRELLADAERPSTPHGSVVPVPEAPAAEEEQVADSAEGMLHVPEAEGITGATDGEPVAAVAEQGAPATAPADVEVPTEITPELLAVRGELADVSPAAEPPAAADASPRPPRASTFDELAFLNSVVDTPQKPATQAFSAAHTEEPRRAELPARGSAGAPRADAAPRPVQPWAAAKRREEPKAAEGAIENLDANADKPLLGASAKPGVPMAANVTGNHPIVLRDKPAENAKTLKCADCGAMNYPTEWYCERCGAELASL